jgi:TonB family protein
VIDFATVLLLATQTGELGASWHWDTEAPICVVQQETAFGKIKISRTPGNEETQLEVTIPKRPADREGKLQEGSINLSPDGTSPAQGFLSKQGKTLKVHAVTLDPSFIQNLSNASALAISSGASEPVRIAFESVATAVEGLRACEDRKMRTWGIDPTSWRSLKSRPIPVEDPRNGFTAFDYPEEAMRAHVEFDAIIRLDVGLDGTVEKCRGLNPGSYKGFETASCAVLGKARFHPATDSAGRPVSAPIVYDVVFRLKDA